MPLVSRISHVIHQAGEGCYIVNPAHIPQNTVRALLQSKGEPPFTICLKCCDERMKTHPHEYDIDGVQWPPEKRYPLIRAYAAANPGHEVCCGGE